MTTPIHHAHLTASGFHDGKLLIDGEPFPFEILKFNYDLSPGSLPTFTLTLYAEKLTIEHELKSREGEWVDIDFERHITTPPPEGTQIRETRTIGDSNVLIEYFLERK